MNEVEEVMHRLRGTESKIANLETAIEYMNPKDHKCHSAFTIYCLIGNDWAI